MPLNYLVSTPYGPSHSHHSVVRHFRMSKKGKKNLTGAMAGMSLEDGGSDGSDEEMERVEVRIRIS